MELKFSYMCGFKMTGSSRTSSICVGIVNLLLMKCSQGLSNGIKKSSLFCFRKFLCLVDLRICVCMSRTKPWLELSIKFSQYSIIHFQNESVRFNNLWIHLVFKEFYWVFMSEIPSTHFQIQSWTRCPGGLIFL